jgi:hypothetical protein
MTKPSTDSAQPRRRSRKALAGLIAACFAVMALLPAGAGAATLKAPTDPWLQYQPPGPGVTPFIFGGFSTPRKACEKRTIDVFRSTDMMNWDYVWHSEAVTGPNPGLTKYLANADRGYYYVLSVERRTIPRPHGKRIVCKPAQSEAVYAS